MADAVELRIVVHSKRGKGLRLQIFSFSYDGLDALEKALARNDPRVYKIVVESRKVTDWEVISTTEI